MKLACYALTPLLLVSSAIAQSYSFNYEHFFGKDDRIGLYSEEAANRFTPAILNALQDNTLLMNCGTSGKPSTAFVAQTQQGSRIISAAHNLTMAEAKNRDCKLGKAILPAGRVSSLFQNNGTLDDAAHDIAQWPNITKRKGFRICETLELSSKIVLVQSMDGDGRLGISPFCKVKSVKDTLLKTTCRGHYKASGAPLLAVTDESICAAGVFNAHSGRRFEYESYAAKLSP